jgi:hypothetical protein
MVAWRRIFPSTLQYRSELFKDLLKVNQLWEMLGMEALYVDHTFSLCVHVGEYGFSVPSNFYLETVGARKDGKTGGPRGRSLFAVHKSASKSASMPYQNSNLPPMLINIFAANFERGFSM